jgi:hypothetical protein
MNSPATEAQLLGLGEVICVPGTAHVLKSESKLPHSGDFGKS